MTNEEQAKRWWNLNEDWPGNGKYYVFPGVWEKGSLGNIIGYLPTLEEALEWVKDLITTSISEGSDEETISRKPLIEITVATDCDYCIVRIPAYDEGGIPINSFKAATPLLALLELAEAVKV